MRVRGPEEPAPSTPAVWAGLPLAVGRDLQVLPSWGSQRRGTKPSRSGAGQALHKVSSGGSTVGGIQGSCQAGRQSWKGLLTVGTWAGNTGQGLCSRDSELQHWPRANPQHIPHHTTALPRATAPWWSGSATTSPLGLSHCYLDPPSPHQPGARKFRFGSWIASNSESLN